MGYESDPLPYHQELRNWSYCIKLSYTTSSSTTQVHLPRPGPTIAPSKSSPASAPPPCRAHIWGRSPSFPLWSPSVSWCTPLWGGDPRLPLPPIPRGTTTLCLPGVFPSALWSVAPPIGGTHPVPWAYTPSPPRACFRTRAPTMPPPYTSIPGPGPLLPPFPAPLLPFPTASNLSAGFGRPLPNHCYCRQSSIIVMGKSPTVAGAPH